MSLPPITSQTTKGEAMDSAAEPAKLKEYEYYVGHVLITAQLTEEQAEAMGAKAPGTAEAPEVGKVPNKEAERGASQMAKPDSDGVDNDTIDPDALNKARDTRNRRSR